mmetsp:Transcript_33824/g.85226  ORF Transcript_33824/g.85226 Transcript_33824/m.85226 type:complete len:340 (-) Transcript_33824:1774-2793(-)
MLTPARYGHWSSGAAAAPARFSRCAPRLAPPGSSRLPRRHQAGLRTGCHGREHAGCRRSGAAVGAHAGRCLAGHSLASADAHPREPDAGQRSAGGCVARGGRPGAAPRVVVRRGQSVHRAAHGAQRQGGRRPGAAEEVRRGRGRQAQRPGYAQLGVRDDGRLAAAPSGVCGGDGGPRPQPEDRHGGAAAAGEGVPREPQSRGEPGAAAGAHGRGRREQHGSGGWLGGGAASAAQDGGGGVRNGGGPGERQGGVCHAGPGRQWLPVHPRADLRAAQPPAGCQRPQPALYARHVLQLRHHARREAVFGGASGDAGALQQPGHRALPDWTRESNGDLGNDAL